MPGISAGSMMCGGKGGARGTGPLRFGALHRGRKPSIGMA